MIALCEWNKASIGKMLWDLNDKKYRMWISWIHHYYKKGSECNGYQPPIHASWILKAIFKHKEDLMSLTVWADFLNRGWYCTRDMYKLFMWDKSKVRWKKVLLGNWARPRATFITCMAFLGRMPTKNRLRGLESKMMVGVCFAE